MASATILKANTSFSFVGPTGPVSVCKGSTYHRESSLLEGLSEEALATNFDPFIPDHDVERATAAPGERRKGGPRRAKQTDAKAGKSDAEATAAPGEQKTADTEADSKADTGPEK